MKHLDDVYDRLSWLVEKYGNLHDRAVDDGDARVAAAYKRITADLYGIIKEAGRD
jgi:hypothetical protein